MLFPDFTYQVRTAEGKAVAYFNTVPGYWSGDPQALQDLHYYTDALKVSRRRAAQLGRLYFWTVEVLNVPQLFERITRRFRESRLAGANCVVLVSIAVDPEYQRLQIPTMLITAARSTAKRLGLKYIVSPFRPSAYGSYKAERKAAHSSKLFEEYCSLKTEQGLPRDPWMRVLTRNGARFLRPEPRSYRVPGLIESFRRFQRTFKPESWYSPSADVWECGETPTWYVDPFRQQVLSVEPNIWGFMTV
ncbi:MAG TPA: hypothetical protein VJX92_07330 [Methylomirabilota bacterium]|nr:hypothetical protein [Methylomirabilota bacterium]